MRPSNLVPSFYFYKLADALSGPYTALSAYSAGVIDAQGNILKPESSIDAFEYLVIKLKKIIDQLPYGMTKAQLGNYLSSIQYFSEAFEEFEITQEQFHCMMEGFVCQATNNEVSYLELLEDMSVGAGGGAPGSLGTPVANSQGPGVAGYDPKLGMPMQRRKQPKYFDNCEVFEVCPEEFIQFKAAKQWKDIPEGENKNYIQRFQRRNKNTKVAVKSLNPLNGENEMHWISYPAHNFMESTDIKSLFETIIEPEVTKKGNTRGSEVTALERTAAFLKRLGFEHVPWTENLSRPRQFSISPGGRGQTDMLATNADAQIVPVEVKSIAGKESSQYNSFNSDLSAKTTPKGVAGYASVAHGLVDIFDPDFHEKMGEILRGQPIENVRKMLEKQGKPFHLTRIPNISYRELKKKGPAERVYSWRTGLLDMAGEEKGGVILAVNPQRKHLHVLNLETGKSGSAVERLLADMGGLRPTGSASTPAEGVSRSGMHLPSIKMAATSQSGDSKMLRADYRFNPRGGITDPWIHNGDMALRDLNLQIHAHLSPQERMEKLTKAED